MKKYLFSIFLVAAAAMLLATTDVRQAQITSKLTVTENLVSPTTSSYWIINGLDETMTYTDGGTRNDVDNVWADTVINSGSIDLTSLTNTLGESLNLTDDVIVAIKFKVQDDEGCSFTIAEGASNGYPLLGASFSFILYANQSMLIKCDTVLNVVSTTEKTIDYTGSNDSSYLSIVLISADSYQ